jgi:hypothetical protein
MANAPTIIKGQLTFLGSIAGQVSVQAQPVAGNNLLFNLPNTVPNPNAVISVLSVVGSTVTLGFTPPPPSSFSFSQITGTIATDQLGNVEGNGSSVQLTNGSLPPSPVTVQLASAASYAVLGTTVTNSDGSSTVITGGNVGGTTVTSAGWVLTPPATVISPASAQALTDLAAAITYYNGLSSTAITTADLGTQGNIAANRFGAGVYKSPSSIAINTNITLDAQGNANAIFVFIATSSTITQASNTTIFLANGAQAANVVWVMTGGGASWTSITPSTTVGNILAGTSITLGGGTLNGRALASTAVTLAAAGVVITVPSSAGVIAAGDVVVYDANGNIESSGILLSSLGGAAGVTSFNTRSGAVSPLSADYAAFYELSTKWQSVEVSAGTVTHGTLGGPFTVNFGTPFADGNYAVEVTAVIGEAIGTGPCFIGGVQKQATPGAGVTVWVTNNDGIDHTVTIHVIARHN